MRETSGIAIPLPSPTKLIDVSGQPLPDHTGGGKSEHQRTPCFLTGRGAGLKACTTASATENRLPRSGGVTVKR